MFYIMDVRVCECMCVRERWGERGEEGEKEGGGRESWLVSSAVIQTLLWQPECVQSKKTGSRGHTETQRLPLWPLCKAHVWMGRQKTGVDCIFLPHREVVSRRWFVEGRRMHQPHWGSRSRKRLEIVSEVTEACFWQEKTQPIFKWIQQQCKIVRIHFPRIRGALSLSHGLRGCSQAR